MSPNPKEDVRTLAYHLWRSAGDEYGRAVDFWLMAEHMVREVSVAATNMTRAYFEAASAGVQMQPPLMRAFYAEQVRTLADAMWKAADAQVGGTMDVWAAAEKHIMAVAERAACSAGATVGAEKAVAKAFETFDAEEYLNQVRVLAYSIWEQAGQQVGTAMDDWVEAERRITELHLAMVPGVPGSPDKKQAAAAAPAAVASGKPASARKPRAPRQSTARKTTRKASTRKPPTPKS